MALLFTRLARNHIKNGYFPTDEETLGRILQALEPAGADVRVLDPCCGEGTALAEIRQHLRKEGSAAEAFGVELDAECAWHAKTLLDRVIHADLHDVVISPRSMGLLFLNPPYGYGVANGDQPAERLELMFLRRTAPLLSYGGVLVFIVPHYVLNDEIATYLGRNFRDLRFFMAPESRFAQCVVFGIRDRARHPPQQVLAELELGRRGELKDRVLPAVWDAPAYRVPPAAQGEDLRFYALRLDPAQLAEEVRRFRSSTLWPGFDACFGKAAAEHLRPLRDMSRWHLALALAAGQVTGLVRSPAGRVLLIKGGTFKQKERSTTYETDAEGRVSETVVLTDRFVPVINAIEFTPGRLGQLVTIR
jgi:SAM-dependent methyltransferase